MVNRRNRSNARDGMDGGVLVIMGFFGLVVWGSYLLRMGEWFKSGRGALASCRRVGAHSVKLAGRMPAVPGLGLEVWDGS
jgi:hypothetical protein